MPLRSGSETSAPVDSNPVEQQKPEVPETPEEVFFEGNGGSNVELALSIVLSATLIYAPLTIASIGRRAWISYKFTNKRLIVSNTSPLFKNQVLTCMHKHNNLNNYAWPTLVGWTFLHGQPQL